VRIGLHTSIAKGLDQAAIEARDAGANCFQIFTSSPRMWRATPPDPAKIHALRTLCQQFDLTPLVVHANYLINLGGATPELLQQSILAFRGELERAIAIGADFLVTHPGSAKGHASVNDAIDVIAASVAAATTRLDPGPLRLLFENTAGQGQSVGSRFEDLARLREQTARLTKFPTGFCLDTCHCFAAGYDVRTAAGLKQTLAEAGRLFGLEHVAVIHANDSKGALGSQLDRHQHIGRGEIGEEGFRRLLRHPQLRTKAFILETPVDDEVDDRQNIATLKRLSAR
jgi:deoxyribonuclease-4